MIIQPARVSFVEELKTFEQEDVDIINVTLSGNVLLQQSIPLFEIAGFFSFTFKAKKKFRNLRSLKTDIYQII